MTFRRSMASSAMLRAVSTPIVMSEPGRSLSIVEATPTTGNPAFASAFRPHLRAAAADDDEAVDAASPEDAERLLASHRRLERVAARAAEDRSALLDDSAHVARAERRTARRRGVPRSRGARQRRSNPARSPRGRRRGSPRSCPARRLRSSGRPCFSSCLPSFPAQAGAVNGHSAFLRAVTRYATTPAPRTARPAALNPFSGERKTKPQRRSATSAGSG